MLELLGWTASLCLACCAAPQAWQCIKTRSANGISTWFLVLWFVGEVLALAYVLLKDADIIQIANYTINLLFLFPILFYKTKELYKKC